MDRQLLAWLLELIRRAPEPTLSGAVADSQREAIELTVRGRRFRILVLEVLA